MKTINKEVSDALHMLLHCSLKDTEFETQREQFDEVYNYIKKLEDNWNELKNWLDNICFYDNDTITYEQISDKIQELEGNNERSN